MKKRILSLLLVAALATASLAGCGQKPSNADTSEKTSETVKESESEAATSGTEVEEKVAYEDLPTINVLFVHGYTYESDDNPIWRAVAEEVGAKIHFIGADTDKYNTMITSGDGYDILVATRSDMSLFAASGTLLALDDLVAEKGPNITANISKFIDYSKEIFSDDSGALYWLPAVSKYSGETVGYKDSEHGLIRWDLYAEMGYPETNSAEEYVQMLADMRAANPTNEAGEKVYGMTIPSDKLTTTFTTPFVTWAGMSTYQKTASFSWDDMSYTNIYGEDGIFWDGIDFYHKAYQAGILDPDAFTLTEADMKAKAAAGRLLFINASWQYDVMPEGQGFSDVPLNWASSLAAAQKPTTKITHDYGFAINKKSKNVELCMKYLDFVMSEEGANLIFNGFEGVHYTVDANGVRSLTEEGVALYNDGAAWAEAGLGTTEVGHFVGLAKDAIASDGKTMLLGLDATMFVNTLTDTQKDFAAHYGVDYPAQAFIQNAEKNNLPQYSDVNGMVRNFLPVPTDDIAQLESAVVSEAEGLIASLVMADEDEYEAKVQAAKEQLAKVGVTKIDEWYNANWQSAFDKAEAYK